MPINFEFLYALAGKTLGSLGELRPISLAERVRVLKASMDHMDSLRAATSTSSKTEQLIGVGGSASQFAREHSNFNPNSLDQSPEPLSSWTNSPKLHEVTFQIGFEFDDGIFLANSNDRTWWLVHKKRKQLTELVWQGEQDGQVVLKDRLRELVYHVPKFGGQATIQGNSPKITRPWRLTTAVPSR